MNIFDPRISGSLSVSGSGEISGDLRVLGTINATISGTTSNAISASHAAEYTLTSSFHQFTSSYTTGSFTGSFIGDGSGLMNIPASGVTGLNLTQIADGSVTASVSNSNGLRVNSNTEITGSLTVTGDIIGSADFDTLRDKPTLVSGSSQITISDTTGYSTFSSSIATTDLNQSNRLTSIEDKTGSYATTGSNLFKGTQTHSGSILPSVDNTYDLGSVEYQWRDVYISSGSLYIDGTKVISSTAQELVITTDNGQSIKILEGTTDSIILQTADGDIELKSSADGDILLDPTNGKILLKGPIEVLSGQKIQSSVGGTPVVFASDIVVSGSIDITGTIEGINLTDFSSSVNSRLGSVEGGVTSLNSFTSSASGRLNSIESTTSSLNSFTSSISGVINDVINNGTLISGSVQVQLSGTTGYSTFSSSVSSSIGNISSSISTTTLGLSSSIDSLSSSVSIEDVSIKNRLNSLEGLTGSYATTSSNRFVGDQTVTGSLTITQNLLVLGSSSLLIVTSSQLALSSSIISVNVFEPAERFGGLEVFDSGSSSATASLLWDSLNNHWIYQNASGSSYSGGMLLSGPRNTGSLGDEVSLTSGKIPRSVGGDHLDNSIMTQSGGNTISISGSLIITGSIIATGTSIISGSEQVISLLPLGTVSGSSQVLNGSTVWSSSAQLPSGIISGAAQLPSGVVSGSSQVLNGSGVWSGSAQLPSGVVSGSSQITYGSISGIPSGIVSGSSQISYPSLSNIPGGIVSGSSQIDLTATTNYSTGIKTRLNAEGVISGSSQITLTSTQVTNGLGYTPYNSTNPNGYITGISFANVSSKPTTLSGYGITDSLYQASYSGLNVNAFNGTGLYRGSTDNWTNKPTVVHNGGALLQIDTHPGNYHQQLFFDSGGNRLYMRSADAGTWGSWVTMIHSGTIGSQSVNYATTAGSAPNATNVNTNYDVSAGNGNGLRFWNGSDSYKISMGNSSLYTYGTVSDYSIKMQMNDADSGRGFTWGRISYAPIASLNSTSGNMQIAGNFTTAGLTSNGVAVFNSTNDTQLSLRSTDAWAGIEFDDSGTADYIWYNGGNQTFSIGGGGGNVSGKKLHVHGGMTIGSSYTATSVSTNGLTVEGTMSASNFSGSSSGTNTGDQTNISGNAATATTATNLSGLGTIQSTSTGTSYTTNYQVRENSGGGGNTNEIYAPQLAFHWSGVVASSIMMEASGRIAIRNNPGGSYENFIASTIYASSSFQGNLTGNVTGNVTGTANNITAYTINQNLGTSNSPTFSNIYANDWYRNNAVNEGLYNEATNNHWYSENSGRWTAAGTNATYGEISLRYGHQGTYKGSYYWDNSGIGLLNEQGGWSVRCNYGSGYGGTLYGSWTVTGTLTETSSTRYKTNIQTIESGLDKVLQMRGVVYNRKDNGKEEIGVIAEEMNEILPQVIQYNTESEIDSVSYSRIVGVLIEAIKELKQEINDLKNNG